MFAGRKIRVVCPSTSHRVAFSFSRPISLSRHLFFPCGVREMLSDGPCILLLGARILSQTLRYGSLSFDRKSFLERPPPFLDSAASRVPDREVVKCVPPPCLDLPIAVPPTIKRNLLVRSPCPSSPFHLYQSARLDEVSNVLLHHTSNKKSFPPSIPRQFHQVAFPLQWSCHITMNPVNIRLPPRPPP